MTLPIILPDRGPYNYDASLSDINAQRKIVYSRQERWGGLMRSIDQTDFETANVEYIECWVQDPFIENPASKGGNLYINLGNVSEDVLKIPGGFMKTDCLLRMHLQRLIQPHGLGVVPTQSYTGNNAFSNDPNDRPFQDVGFDGLNRQCGSNEKKS